MNAFERILARTPETTKRKVEKKLAIANRIIEILRGVKAKRNVTLHEQWANQNLKSANG